MAKRLFEAAEHTALYAKYRLPVSKAIMSPILNRLSKSRNAPYDIVLDVGCGSGQAAGVFHKHFGKYIGIDISTSQIAQANASAKKPRNAEFRVGPCENLSFLEDNSVDMINASQSYHWFDHSMFCKEAQRILKPGGILAIYSFIFLEAVSEVATKEQNEAIIRDNKPCYDILYEATEPVVEYVKKGYRTVELPYEDVEYFNVRDSFKQDFAFLKNYLQTQAVFRNFLNEDPLKAKNILDTLQKNYKCGLGNLWKGEETPLTITRPYVVAVCRKPKEKKSSWLQLI